MDANSIFQRLFSQGDISEETLHRLKYWHRSKPISLHTDITTVLYLGVTMLTTGIGILVYKNIDTIGHQVILAFIALASVACYGYCIKMVGAYSWKKIESPNVLFDYILLLGCLLMITFIGYLQYQYHVFGERYGIATFIPMVILFISAYYFDHLGVLSLAITNLGAWLGITVTPLHLWQANNFDSSRVIFTGIGLATLLQLVSFVSKKRSWKAHFEFTYDNFGANAGFVSLLAAMFYFDHWYFAWFLLFAAFAFFRYFKAFGDRSFYFMVITILYSYVALSYVVIRWLTIATLNEGIIYLGILYFMVSAFGLVLVLVRINKLLKQ
jgi:hypothetical protein